MTARLCLLVGSLAASAAFGQSGRLTGSVLDASNSPVPNVKVQLSAPGGSASLFETVTSAEGVFRFVSLQPVMYDLTVEAPGFRKGIVRGLKVDTGVEVSLKPILLEISSQAEVVEVTADAVGVQTNNAEIASVVTNAQLQRLPSLNRSPLAFISLQAGVGSNGRSNTTINGMRPSFSNVTLDGINIQDNFIRTNGLDFLPNMMQLDQIAEISITTSNSNAALGNGAAQIAFSTPSGTNKLRGAVYWFNRNNTFAANTWFNNRNGIARPFLNQNQPGATLGGAIIKNKLFYYVNYEATRLRQQSSTSRTILTADARNGIFKYRSGGVVQSVNVLQASGLGANSAIASLLQKVPGAENINRTDIGDGLNTGGYGFNIRNNRTRDNVTARIDYNLSQKHTVYGSYVWNRDILDRPDLANDYERVPKTSNDNSVPFVSMTYRWSPGPTFTNEARGGMNSAPAVFATSETFGAAIFGLPLVSNPVNTFRAQGRYTDTYNIADNANWTKGRHTIAFGYQGQKITVNPFNDAGITPTYTLGMSAANARTLTTAQVPGVSANDLATANALVALLGGQVSSFSQTFNVADRTSGYTAGAPSRRNFKLWNHAMYVNDVWRMTPRLTLTMGTRWEYFSPVDETNSLVLLPQLQNNDPIRTLLSNSTLDFAGNSVGRPWYKKDLNNFSPNIGIAWQPFKDNGKTVVRMGYSVNFPNDDFIRSVDNSTATNAGLSTGVARTGLAGSASALPAIPVPAFKVPRTFADNYALDSTAAFAMPDPNLRTPYVQQYSIGIQRELLSGVLEVRYVGNHGTKQFRAFDYNQVQIRENGFLADFIRAQNNGLIAQRATGTFNPAFNPNLAGSQRLPVFDAIESGGLLTNGTVRGLIQQGQAGELATVYQTNGFGGANFFRNPNALGTNLMTNYSNSSYNGLQVDFQRRFKNGLQWQANYVYSKTMSDAAGDGQTRFEPFLDLTNGGIERARVPFDITHVFKVNSAWDVPIGRGRKVDVNRWLDYAVGGWVLAGFMTWQSGDPFSIQSLRGTLNRAARSANNTATSALNKGQLDNLIYFRQTGNGPYFIDPAAIGTDGRGVAADGAAAFSGQAFTNPGPGDVGTLQRRMFSGPAFWNTDISIQKNFVIKEGHTVEFRGEMFNFSNHPSFFFGDQNINSVQFGRITSVNSGRRVVQFGLKYKF